MCVAVELAFNGAHKVDAQHPPQHELLKGAVAAVANPNGAIVRVGSGQDEEVTLLVHTVIKPGFIDEYWAWTECVRFCGVG